MASTTFSLSLSTLASSTAYNSGNHIPTISCKSNEKSSLCLSSSSFLGSRLNVSRRTSSANPMSMRNVRIACSASVLLSALLFDCDGVLVDTEKDGHRISFNDTFKEVTPLALLPLVLFFCSD